MGRIKIEKDGELDYPVVGTRANMDIDIWIKFTGYINDTDLAYIEEIRNMRMSDISEKQMNKYDKIMYQVKMSNLLMKYKARKCNKTEHNKVVKFMEDNYLREFVESKMSDEDIKSAYIYVSDLVSRGVIKEYIKLNQQRYEELSIYEAYVLFFAKEVLYDNLELEYAMRTMEEEKEKAKYLRKSLVRDFGIY